MRTCVWAFFVLVLIFFNEKGTPQYFCQNWAFTPLIISLKQKLEYQKEAAIFVQT